MTRNDPSVFPLREGVNVPREMIAGHAAALMRAHGESIEVLAARGGISVFELLLLIPGPDGVDPSVHQRNICDLTLTQAIARLTDVLAAFHKKREEEAELAMLAMMEAEAAAADAGAEAGAAG
jgi:hypothetical protein